MSLGSPTVLMRGVVRRFTTEDMPARPAVAEERDPETRRLVREARPAAPAYVLATVTVDTGMAQGAATDSGLGEVSYRFSDGDNAGRQFEQGDQFEEVVRPFVIWRRFGLRSSPVLAFGLAASQQSVNAPRGARAAVSV